MNGEKSEEVREEAEEKEWPDSININRSMAKMALGREGNGDDLGEVRGAASHRLIKNNFGLKPIP
jgi:hypothetical protein